MTLEVPALGHTPPCGDVGCLLLGQTGGGHHLGEFVEGPDVELALFAFAVGVLGRVEPAVRMAQVTQDVVDGLLDHPPVPLLAGHLPGVEVGTTQRRLVVEHLLEVRYQPPGIDRVAVEAPSELVVHTAGGHGVERAQGDLARRSVAGADVVAQEMVEAHRLRKLRRAAEASELPVVVGGQLGGGAIELLQAQPGVGSRSGELPAAGQRRRQLARLGQQLLAPVAPRLVDRLQQPGEPGQAVPVLLGVVRPAVERLPLGGEEHRHRPSAPAGHRLHRRHVDGVDVGPLLPVDLDVHEQPVHDLGRRRILERLVGHHVAPVAGRVPHRQHDRLVLGPGLVEGLVPHGYQSTGLSLCWRR